METAEQVKGAPYRILNRREIWEERRMIAKALTSQGAESIVHEHNCYDDLLEACKDVIQHWGAGLKHLDVGENNRLLVKMCEAANKAEGR